MTPAEFERLDRLARLAVLREVQHHVGIHADEYVRLAAHHEYLLGLAYGIGRRRPQWSK
jgi:hypothetical protein